MTRKPKIKPEDVQACDNCRFFAAERPQESSGSCRLNPPRAVVVNDELIMSTVTVMRSDWCGQYSRRTQ